jgi:NAD(P)-dependent dehydrogenase (short-subunit alcohol dehydrogenase family)
MGLVTCHKNGVRYVRLANKVALITGAGSGIGKATATLFAKEGAKISVADLDEKGGKATVNVIKNAGGEAIFTKCDVTNEADVRATVDRTVEAYGKIDILFNNAGVEYVCSIFDTDEENWNRIMNINAKGVFLCTKHVAAVMKKNRSGSIINAGSVAGLVATPLNVAYCASKGAVVMMTKAMAIELAPFGIRVNATCPASIVTPLMDREIAAYGKPREVSEKEVIGAHPIGRMGNPEEVAYAALYLASDDSSFVTGSNLMVDGGYTAQ